MDRSKGFFITVICFVYFVICVLSVVYFFFSNFSFFSLDYNTPVSFLGTLLTIPQALFLMSIFILITSLILLSKIKSMVAFFKKATYLFAIYNISVAFCAALFLFIPCIYSCQNDYKSVVNTGEISLSRVVLLEEFGFGAWIVKASATFGDGRLPKGTSNPDAYVALNWVHYILPQSLYH